MGGSMFSTIFKAEMQLGIQKELIVVFVGEKKKIYTFVEVSTILDNNKLVVDAQILLWYFFLSLSRECS